MKMKKSAIKALIATGIIVGLLITTFMQLGSSSLTAYDPNNMTVTGVLATDTYVLYPYTAENLVWGFSKYGELINGAAKQGLEYAGMDVFANPNVLEKDWSQGWYIDIHYADLSNSYQHAWAYALYSDLSGGSGIGGDWKENVTNGPLGTPYGGRKTNVWATTDPITVLYDGPRSFVAECRTTLYAASDRSVANSGLVNITITFVFDKVKKEIVEYKDIKRLDQGKFGRDFQVEFSNRGEWDIGTTSSPPSYAQIYYNQSTVYDYNYQPYYNSTFNANTYDVAQILDQSGTYAGFVAYWPSPFGIIVKPTKVITRTEVLSSLCTVEQNVTWDQIINMNGYAFNFTAQNWPTTNPFPIGGGIWSNEPMIFKNNVLLYSPGDYTWDPSGTVTFALAPALTDRFIIDYKHHQPDNTPASYNMGYWSPEPGTPYVIGEWDFKLTTVSTAQQFRGVCVYGLTDRHDGDDYDAAHGLNAEDWSTGQNIMDREIMYQLNETFNPWDLSYVVKKDTTRWVDYTTNPLGTTYWVLTKTPVLNVSTAKWDQYAVFSERVEDLNGTVLNRYLGDYALTVTQGVGNITGLNATHQYKILYSTGGIDDSGGRYEWITVGRDAHTVDSAGATLVSAAFSENDIEIGNAGMDMEGTTYAYEIPYLLSRIGNGTTFSNYWITPDTTSPGQRLTLMDDWCTKWAVTSSNIISVGGPLANQMTEYFNSFTDAYYSEPWFTPYTPFKGTLAALSCWSKKAYSNNATLNGTGYATIGTYLDINGTVGLAIYGLDARDTFYASQYFRDNFVTILGNLPKGVTSLVIKIGYKDYRHPTFTIVEELGTISEYGDWLHPDP
jgi:hypothetical protein